ncbi:MAG: hypothetical protein LCH58_10125 [Bacteroidetes bacterium]|jgi:hypothetical protein|uniref:hypothetical protein n=1 Tax=Phnomibacter sp. TaxID=2836217 RepID=UPI002FDE9355|nr:hypothetical protein [Bacteroidota bacterium]
MATHSSIASTQVTPAQSASGADNFSAEMAILMTAAFAGTAMSKRMRKQYRSMMRKAFWMAAKQKLNRLFRNKQDQIAGMAPWLFILLVVAAAAIGVALFGLWGFIVILALAAIIYLLLKQSM